MLSKKAVTDHNNLDGIRRDVFSSNDLPLRSHYDQHEDLNNVIKTDIVELSNNPEHTEENYDTLGYKTKHTDNEIFILSNISSNSILDDSDKDKDYIPPGENKRHLGEFDDDLEVEVINNDSTEVDMDYSDNEQNILSLMNYLCENVCQEP
ncbi:uncharacterized protein LOC113557795 [Rhopalosiphum maidis]|uniref:uncharacterized protein LOC113557795 n=1 Tax=Rhopalosiphum maidis TaxID=43146 RepID=UPI000EFE6BFE|nr:uncharacterized protein LOC113557795 [Rhopalosiphum maidis]